MKWIIREQQRNESEYNAGSKARADVDSVLTNCGFSPLVVCHEIDTSEGFIKKATLHFTRYYEWKKCLVQLNEGDTVVIQFPIRNHTVFLKRIIRAITKKNVKVIAIIHDLESLRQSVAKNIPIVSRIRFKLEEKSVLKYFSFIIVHNGYMKEKMQSLFRIPETKMIELDIFDYLYNDETSNKTAQKSDPIVIAGNLDIRKSGYIYNLPQTTPFILYGANYDVEKNKGSNVTYYGKVNPNVLPGIIKGSFGLVWDGPSISTCEGVYGEYLKINNPHKTSLYLAAGLPVIVWKESAMADFVLKTRCGMVVDSLENINTCICEMTNDNYEELKKNAEKIGDKIRNGDYIKEAVAKCELQ